MLEHLHNEIYHFIMILFFFPFFVTSGEILQVRSGCHRRVCNSEEREGLSRGLVCGAEG